MPRDVRGPRPNPFEEGNVVPRQLGVREGGVPAVTASDFDGHLHLVALVDDVSGWEVTVIAPDGSATAVQSEPFSGGYHTRLAGRPSWWIEQGLGWRLSVGGQRVAGSG
jgi:hypothetical protein